MSEETTANATRNPAGRLRWARLGTWGAIHLERLWPLLLPLVLVVSLFVSASWFGLFRLMPGTARLVAVGVFVLAALAALYPLRFFRRPTAIEIDRRIESSNRLLHAPVTVQSDRLAGRDTNFADALWREHQRRMAERLANLSGDLPRTGLNAA